MIEGIDCSYYQGDIDWLAVAAAGKRFAIVRSGDGIFEDPLFEQNVQGAVAAGIHVEVYHYLRFVLDPSAHAELLVTRLEMAKRWGAAPRLWLDWEDTSNAARAMTEQQRRHWASGLIVGLHQQELGFYTGTWWWEPYMGDFRSGHRPLWIAQYPFDNRCQSDPTATSLAPTLPASWVNWLIWQYTSQGRCPGIEGYVDLNVAQDSFLKEETMPGLTEERLNKILVDRDRANKLEWAARGAVADKAFAAVITALTGHWENLPINLEDIRNEATRWHRWPE